MTNLAKLVVNSAVVTDVAYDGLQATIRLNTSYGVISVFAGVPDGKVHAALAAGLDNAQAQGDLWTADGDGWCPKILHRYGLETILALLEKPAIQAWRTWEPE